MRSMTILSSSAFHLGTSEHTVGFPPALSVANSSSQLG